MTNIVAKIKLNGAWFYNTKVGYKSFMTGQIYSLETMRVMYLACDKDKRVIVWRA
jgi:hypothetical protein